MARLSMSVFLIIACTVSLLGAAGPIGVSDDIDSGSLGTWRVEDNTRLVVVPRRGYDQDSVNISTTWFHGRLTNVLQREVTIELTGLDYGVYNGQKGTILPYERNTVCVFSYDREHWERFSNTSFDKESRTYSMTQVFGRDTVWVAYIVPYPFERLERFLDGIKDHPAISVGSFGRSVEGRALYLVDVIEPGPDAAKRPTAWIVARQHSFESGGTWAVQGLLEFLTSSDPEAASLRKQVNFKLCPMVNPDGVVNGGTRFNARGVDLNRHWHRSDPLSNDRQNAPETALLKETILDWKKTHRLDLWINIHNNDMVWNDDGDYMIYGPKSMELDARRMEAILREELIYTGTFNAPNDEEGTAASTASVAGSEFGCLCLLMEMKTGFLDDLDRWTGKDIFLHTGRGLARAAARYVNQDN